jgi:cytochrome P450
MYSPIQFLPKIAASGTHITYNGRAFGIPKGTHVDLGVCNIHYSSRYYGSNSGEFDITRWDKSNNESFLAQNKGKPQLTAPGLENVDVHKPTRGAFVAFSDGLRSCMGRKFAMVEFVAVVTCLLREHKVEIARRSGETIGDAKARARKALEESYAGLTLGPKEKVGVVFTRRK